MIFRIACFIFFFITQLTLKGQLLMNGDMESGVGGISTVPDGWEIVSGSPDHCESKPTSCSVLQYKIPTASPQGGKWVRFFYGDLVNHEIFGQKLSSPLVKGQGYSISFYVSYAKLNNSTSTTNTRVAFGFSYGKPTSIGTFNSDNIFLTVSEKWMYYTYSFIATGNYDFISFGKVEKDYNNACFIDGIKLVGCERAKIDLGKDTILCEGSELLLDAKNNKTICRWQDETKDSVYRITKAGKYWVNVTNECGSVTDTINIAYFPNTKLNLGNDTTLCDNQELYLDVTQPNATYLWQDYAVNPKYTITQKGTYWVKISNQCGNFDDSIEVNFINKPQIELGNDTTICPGDVVTLKISNPNTNYTWQDSSTRNYFNITKTGMYWVRANNWCGTVYDSIKINVGDCNCKLFIPTVFSPNENNLNELFTPIASCSFTEYQLTIYNRWGELIFKSNNPTLAWDGSFKGNFAPDGVYVYVLQYKFSNNRQIKWGSFGLLR